MLKNSDEIRKTQDKPRNPYEFVFENFNVSELTNNHLLQHSSALPETGIRFFFDIQPIMIHINYASFRIQSGMVDPVDTSVKQTETDLIARCSCSAPKTKLCEHQVRVLYNLMDRKDLRIFFDKKLRSDRLKVVAKDYGLENEIDLDQHFELEYDNKTLIIKPKQKALIPVSSATFTLLENQLLPSKIQNPIDPDAEGKSSLIVVIGQNKYYDHFHISVFDAQTTKEGKVKNPLVAINPLDLLWKTEDTDKLKFYSALAKFQNNHREKNAETDIEGLKSIARNPLELDFYYHNLSASESINAASLVAVKLEKSSIDLHMNVDQKDQFYEISGQLILDGKGLDLAKLQIRYEYFVLSENALHLIDNTDILRVISFFRQHNQKIIIHQSKFEEFRQTILSKLENKIRLTYSYLKPATAAQLQENGFDQTVQKIIYLEDFGNYVMITPVMKYGNVEVPVFSKKQIYSLDNHRNPFSVERDGDEELRFISSLVRQHKEFETQIEGREFYYLHKNDFLKEEWFLQTFEEWKYQGISVLGFSNLTKNKLNPNKAKITVSVVSGINWFDTTIAVHFGKQKITLKHLHKAVKNKTKYIALDDGTTGILPSDWIEKFSKYFEAGEVSGESIRTSKINFASIEEMYEAEVLTNEVREQISFYKSRFSDFHSIQPVEVPDHLLATLRDYQKEGLNWLNFLDDFGFGGCLADDMGLGKTLQIIAFILSQRKKQNQNTNLVIVPTSLIFNWQAEIEKFAPSIKILTIYGSTRVKEITDFDNYEVILTSYGTLLSDVNFLKKYSFNYIFLDESQAIKNPDSQRYKAARLLQARNRIVLTGTPVENNTFDLYGQMSFACPGLLGTKTQFKNHYSNPIDRFQDNQRARDLQRKINPFILRRTKKQVATELPDKTEMVLYCEMGEEQRKVYNAYELEFYTFLNTKNELDIPRESMHVLQGLTKLRQICNSPALLNDHLYYGNASAKIEVLMEQIETKSPQHKILVFSQFVTMLDLIRDELVTKGISFEYLTGQTKDRQARVDNFQNNSKIRVFLISLKAGGTGLNLTEADYVYIVDPWWNPAVENQAIDRSYRIGQKKNVIAVRLICPDTIEEKILHLQESKRDLADDLVKTDTSILKSLSKKDLLELVS